MASSGERPAEGRGAPSRLDRVQLLRAAAAMMVVVLHAQLMLLPPGQRPPLSFLPLGAGVDLFFVISGFIIVYASEPLFGKANAAEFLRRRTLRIVPLYWLALTMRLVVLALAARAGTKVFPDMEMIAASFFFIPYDCQGFGPDYPFPILDLGWSLNYEMFFYLLFACLIGLGRQRAVLVLVAILGAGAILSPLIPSGLVALRFWLQPITLEFAAGACIALLYRRGTILHAAWRRLFCIAALAIWLFLPISLLDASVAPGSYSWPRLLLYGCPAILLLSASVLRRPEGGALAAPVLALGDASYALYLLHPFVLTVAHRLTSRWAHDPLLVWPIILLAILATVLVAHFVHKRIERPIIKMLQRLTDARRPPRRLIVDA